MSSFYKAKLCNDRKLELFWCFQVTSSYILSCYIIMYFVYRGELNFVIISLHVALKALIFRNAVRFILLLYQVLIYLCSCSLVLLLKIFL